MRNLTDSQRLQIVTLRKHTTKSLRQIAEDLDLSKSAVGRVLLSYQTTGSHHSARSNCGRHRVTSAAEDRLLIRMSKKDPRASSVQLQSELSAIGIDITSRTVRNRLQEAGRFAYKPISCQLLTNEMKRKRLRWAEEHKDWTLEMWASVS